MPGPDETRLDVAETEAAPSEGWPLPVGMPLDRLTSIIGGAGQNAALLYNWILHKKIADPVDAAKFKGTYRVVRDQTAERIAVTLRDSLCQVAIFLEEGGQDEGLPPAHVPEREALIYQKLNSLRRELALSEEQQKKFQEILEFIRKGHYA